MKTYTEIYHSNWSEVEIYPFVPEGTEIPPFATRIRIALTNMEISPLFMPSLMTEKEWNLLFIAMQRAFQISNFTVKELGDYLQLKGVSE